MTINDLIEYMKANLKFTNFKIGELYYVMNDGFQEWEIEVIDSSSYKYSRYYDIGTRIEHINNTGLVWPLDDIKDDGNIYRKPKYL